MICRFHHLMEVTEFKHILEYANFREEDIIKSGCETIVFQKKGIPFVLKRPNLDTPNDFNRTIDSYQLAANKLGGLTAKVSLLDMPIRINGILGNSSPTIVQEAGIPLDEAIEDENIVNREYALKKLLDMEHEIMNRGLLVNDNYFKNTIVLDQKIILADLGCLSTNLHELGALDEYPFREDITSTYKALNQRGFVLTERLNHLKLIGDLKAIDTYVEAIGVDYDPNSYVFGISGNDVNNYSDLIKNLLGGFPLREHVNTLERIGLAEGLVGFLSSVKNINEEVGQTLQDEIINIVVRNKYHHQFVDVATSELEKYFRQSEGIESEEYIVM